MPKNLSPSPYSPLPVLKNLGKICCLSLSIYCARSRRIETVFVIRLVRESTGSERYLQKEIRSKFHTYSAFEIFVRMQILLRQQTLWMYQILITRQRKRYFIIYCVIEGSANAGLIVMKTTPIHLRGIHADGVGELFCNRRGINK